MRVSFCFLLRAKEKKKEDMTTFFESGCWVWIPDEEEVVLPAKAKSAFRLGERATVVLENGAVSCLWLCLRVCLM